MAGTITAEGRVLTKTMDKVNKDYWYNQWHLDTKLHDKLGIINVTKIDNNDDVSIYADTDSCSSNTIIRTNNGNKPIEQWYNDNIINGTGGITINGHESVLTKDKILNYSNGELYYSKVKRIIRHKVKKPKWKLRTKSGKEVIVTNDHSMIVFRNGIQLEVKPSDILRTDKILIVEYFMSYCYDDIETCEVIGEFDNEWVYDVEVDDDTHTFIANDILVHNSLFVSFKPAIDHCTWKNLIFNDEYLNSIDKKFIILSNDVIKTSNPNCIGICCKSIHSDNVVDEFEKLLKLDYDVALIDGSFIKDWKLSNIIKDINVIWNWSNELDFIHGIDLYRYADYFKEKLEEHANSYGVENKEDFELERISESVISIAKKKYIQHIVYEDGIPYERMNYIYPKGVELVRSSTPLFAREKIVDIVKYLFSNPDTFNIKDLLKLVKNLRKEFELADIDDISMQSSVSNYETKCINDKSLPLKFVSGAHFAVKSAAHYNYLLSKNKEYQQKYDFIKSGNKIKYYCCKDKSITDMFAYTRGSYPFEFAPEVDYDLQFSKSILSPINSIVEPLGMPTITERLSIVMDIFSGFN